MNEKRLFIILLLTISSSLLGSEVTKYVRYTYQGQESYGILEGGTIHELDGHIFSTPTPSGKSIKLSEVRLLAPCKPSKVIAVGLNYRSHIGNKPTPEYPGLFAKYPSSIIGHEENIVMPSDATNLHFEGEMVIVIGKKAKNISVSDAHNYIFGITAGNDVSERKWQRADLQWLRAKASNTFGPIGPAIVTGLIRIPHIKPKKMFSCLDINCYNTMNNDCLWLMINNRLEGEDMKVGFDGRIKLEFHGAKVTSDGGLLAYRDLEDALGLFDSIATVFTDRRTGRNIQHDMNSLLR